MQTLYKSYWLDKNSSKFWISVIFRLLLASVLVMLISNAVFEKFTLPLNGYILLEITLFLVIYIYRYNEYSNLEIDNKYTLFNGYFISALIIQIYFFIALLIALIKGDNITSNLLDFTFYMPTIIVFSAVVIDIIFDFLLVWLKDDKLKVDYTFISKAINDTLRIFGILFMVLILIALFNMISVSYWYIILFLIHFFGIFCFLAILLMNNFTDNNDFYEEFEDMLSINNKLTIIISYSIPILPFIINTIYSLKKK